MLIIAEPILNGVVETVFLSAGRGKLSDTPLHLPLRVPTLIVGWHP